MSNEWNSGVIPNPVLTDIEGNPATPFDFDRLQEMPDDALGAIADLHRTFVRSVCASLTIPLRSAVTGGVRSVSQTTFGAFADSLPNLGLTVFLRTDMCDAPCALRISPELAWPVLDLLLGGDGKVAFDPARGLTEVEKALLERPISIVARELTRAWSTVVAITFEPGPIRTNPRQANPMGRSERVVAVAAELTVAETTGSLELAVPASLARLVQPDSGAAPNQPRPVAAHSKEAIEERLHRQLLIDVDCELRGSSIRLKDLLDLKVGSVVDLGIACDGAITVCANGRPKFDGWLTQAGSRMAITVK